jgi:hypothetical protein
MFINLIQDTVGSNGSAPAYFMQDMQAAANFFDSTFTNNITINLRVGWGSDNNTVDSSLTGSGGAYASGLNGQLVSFSTVSSWLTASESSANDIQAYSTLAGLGLSGNQQIFVDSAQEKALGHYTGSSLTVDGYAAFGTGISNALLVGVAIHEFAHAFGRNTIHYNGGNPTIMDLFRYNSNGSDKLQWNEADNTDSAYFSINGGKTDLADFSTTSDYGDLVGGSGSKANNDPFDAFYSSSTVQSLTALDKEMMDILGYSTKIGGGKGITGEPSDILWANGQQVGEWTMSNNNPTWNLLSSNANGWTVVGRGDYNGDGTRDILWYNAQAQQLGEWVNGNSSTWTLLSSSTNGWTVVGSGDYNGDHTSDILWYNAQSQQLGDFIMNNNNSTWNSLSGNTNGWTVVGSGDYNGDGTSDILWYNAQSQQLGDWIMHGNSPTWNSLSGSTNGWTVVGSGDYNGDGTSDILWYNAQSQQLGDWIMNGNSPTWNSLSSNTNGWTVVGSGDYNGDGTDDILWYNAQAQQLGDWVMHNNSPTWNSLSSNTNGWSITGGMT